MQTLKVELGSRSYPILIGSGLLDRSELYSELLPAQDVLLVSNVIVEPLYGARVRAALEQHRGGPRRIVDVILPDGEAHKTLATVARVFDVLVANRYSRDACVLALGGGVVGDAAGFAAACYQRGINFVQLPTTLLAQVDSSVGGKTGVNHPGGKNLIGAFHQPRAVIADTDTLATLPDRELRAGLAEVIKYGLISDAKFFEWLEASIDKLLARDAAAVAHAIRRSCEVKAEIVARDERESGERALLNLGHTFGHALEAATNYEKWLHGEAVGTGMLMAATMSHRAGLLDAVSHERVRRLLARAGFRSEAREVSVKAALEAMRIDKKVKDGRMRFVLLNGIGHSLVTADYPQAALTAALAEHLG